MQKSLETVNCVGLVPVSETVSNPVGDAPVFLTEKVCGELVASTGVEPKPRLVGEMPRAAGAGVVLVVVVLVLGVVVDARVVDVVWVVVEIVLVVELVVGSVIGLSGHSPWVDGARSRNACASSRLMRLSEPNSTWYVSPPPRITRRRHPLVPGFGGTTVIAPPSPRAFTLMTKTRPAAPARRMNRTGPFKPRESSYMKPVVPLALHPLAGRKKSWLVDVAPTAKKVRTAPAVVGSPTIVLSVGTSFPRAWRRRCVDTLFTRALRPSTVWSAARALDDRSDDRSMVSAIRILGICLIVSTAALLPEPVGANRTATTSTRFFLSRKIDPGCNRCARRSRRAAVQAFDGDGAHARFAQSCTSPTTRGQVTTPAGAKTIARAAHRLRIVRARHPVVLQPLRQLVLESGSSTIRRARGRLVAADPAQPPFVQHTLLPTDECTPPASSRNRGSFAPARCSAPAGVVTMRRWPTALDWYQQLARR